MTVAEDFTLVGTGRSVYTTPEPVEGPVVWLDSPQAVIEFVGNGDVADSIVLARGGTTTFLTPALTAGVKGVLTLQGAPESHLGILSREYGIPCIMGVQFEDGVRSDRGEVIPADGVRVRMDLSGPEGRVLVEPGAPSAGAKGEPTEEEKALAEQMKQVEVLLHHFRGEVPHGSAGDEAMRAKARSDALRLTDESLRRTLTADECNDLLDYFAWNVWDALALRSTEGESGLIPRQEYEAFGAVQMWQRYPELVDRIVEAVGGLDGVVELGRTARREVGSKVNQLHMWCSSIVPLFGRGLLVKLGMADPNERTDEVERLLQFQRALMRGFWDDEGLMFASSRGYRAPVLAQEWIDRLSSDVTSLEDPDRRSLYQRFNATTEITGFLLHFDNRSGLSDTGPYPLPDGGFMIVRDHFLHDPAYHWHDVAEDLPHGLTQAMVFHPEGDLRVNVLDIGTLFSEPSNYLSALTHMAVYARDTIDTPIEDLRRVDEDEMESILATCETATTQLYKRMSRMSARDKIMAGAQVYYTEFIAPFARAAGVWGEFVQERDFFEIDPLAAQAYYPLVTEKKAAQIVPEAFLMGGYDLLERVGDVDAEAHAEHYPTLHAIALRGMLTEVPGGHDVLVESGLAVATGSGVMLSPEGQKVHDALLAAERAGADTDRIRHVYERFLPINVEFKGACSSWHGADEGTRASLLADLERIVERVEPALRRTAEVVPRFETYGPRLRGALGKAQGGDHEQVTSPTTDSLHTVWMELHEDYIQLLEIDREEEGSY